MYAHIEAVAYKQERAQFHAGCSVLRSVRFVPCRFAPLTKPRLGVRCGGATFVFRSLISISYTLHCTTNKCCSSTPKWRFTDDSASTIRFNVHCNAYRRIFYPFSPSMYVIAKNVEYRTLYRIVVGFGDLSFSKLSLSSIVM